MNSIRERILQALASRLAPIAQGEGAQVLRSPTTAITREASPALLIFPEAESIAQRANDRIERLTALAREQRVAIMCGEPMPWRCHRLLIANTLTARGWTVTHLMTNALPQVHRLGQWGAAPVVGPDGVVTYPA